VEPGIKLLQEAGIEAVREKSLRLSGLLLGFHEAVLAPMGYHLGDFYTTGEGIDPREAWPAGIRDRLESGGYPVARSCVLACTGWTVADLAEASGKAGYASEWDWITLCIGVNDQYNGGNPVTFAAQLDPLRSQVETFRAKSGSRVLVLSIPDWSVSPFALDRDRVSIARQIDAFSAAAHALSRNRGLGFLDWTFLSRRFPGDQEAFARDGLHPSAIQHAAWARFLEESLLRD